MPAKNPRRGSNQAHKLAVEVTVRRDSRGTYPVFRASACVRRKFVPALPEFRKDRPHKSLLRYSESCGRALGSTPTHAISKALADLSREIEEKRPKRWRRAR